MDFGLIVLIVKDFDMHILKFLKFIFYCVTKIQHKVLSASPPTLAGGDVEISAIEPTTTTMGDENLLLIVESTVPHWRLW